MALDVALAGRVYATALALIASGGGRWDGRTLANELAARYRGMGFTGNISEFRAIVNRAIQGVDSAQTMNNLPVGVLGQANYPTLPTIGPDDPQYLLRVLVTATSATGRETTVIEVRSDTLITAAEAVRRAIEIARNMSPRRTTNPRFVEVGSQGDYSGEVQSIGQRG